MAELSGKARAAYVKQMFARLARRYDMANHWMTWGQDTKWRGEVIDRTCLPVGGKLLDIGTGTGDLALEARRKDKTLLSVGVDFTTEMIRQGQTREGGVFVCWAITDALDLPFDMGTFDAVVSGYFLRNVSDVERALAEQYRVLKPDGYMVCLDTTPPPNDFWHLPVRVYLNLIIPIVGSLITGDFEAYRYLPESTSHFLRTNELVDCVQRVGFREVGFRRFMGGTMAVHWGVK